MNTLSKITKPILNTGKLLAHPILGILPFQEKLEKKIKWYNADMGVTSNSALEFFGALGYLSLGGDYKIAAIACGVEALGRIDMVISSDSPFYKDFKPYGTFALELPFNIIPNKLKKAYEEIKFWAP